MAKRKLWAGRFQEQTHEAVEAFTASIGVDRRLYRQDIAGSIAHARMLGRQGIISETDAVAIVRGLRAILRDMEAGRFAFDAADEDIHMAVERALIARIGEVGGRLHTGRSRNDQVALDVRMYLREAIVRIRRAVKTLQGVLATLAKQELGTIMPGYTHLQKAQPVLLSHYLLAHWEMLERDDGRLRDCLRRVNVLPLGAAALAGTGLPIDRAWVARALRFRGICRNSMDAVSDRDFAVEFLSAAALIMMHLSRFCEDLVIWSSGEFGFVEISDAFATGSSIMPQKKNPDVAELIRGKTGRVYGHLVAVLTVLKGLPLTYNRDLQEDKEPLFDAVDTLERSLDVLAKMAAHLRFNRNRMRTEAAAGYATATDLAEYLVKKGVPFRKAHEIVGKIVAYAHENNKTLDGLTLREYRSFYEGFDADVHAVTRVEQAIAARQSLGGTAESRVRDILQDIERSQ